MKIVLKTMVGLIALLFIVLWLRWMVQVLSTSPFCPIQSCAHRLAHLQPVR